MADLPDVPIAPMLKLADRHASEACARKSVRVQLPLGALWQADAHGSEPCPRFIGVGGSTPLSGT